MIDQQQILEAQSQAQFKDRMLTWPSRWGGSKTIVSLSSHAEHCNHRLAWHRRISQSQAFTTLQPGSVADGQTCNAVDGQTTSVTSRTEQSAQ